MVIEERETPMNTQGNQMNRKITFEQAKAQYIHRFTMDHTPAWARDTEYKPHYASDREWYENTVFPGEKGIHGNSKHCYSSNQSWPLGR
jgi:hypothetical protein